MDTTRQLFPAGTGGDGPADRGILPYTILDVFTSNPLEGNQLAIFTDARYVATGEMQKLARELNLSETVFFLPAEADGDVRIRIFTPRHELPFAGHPVLGSAFVVAEVLRTNSVSLETGIGAVPVDLTRDGARIVFGRMRQPVPVPEPYERAGEVLAALRVDASQLPVEAYRNGAYHVFVMLGSPDEVAALKPDLTALAEHSGVAVNCFARSGDRWRTRMFAPALGVSEDPATGSAAGPLAVHLARHGLIEFGQEIEILQGDEIGRPSVLRARAIGTADAVERVEVGGSAVVVAKGTYLARSARAG